MRRWWPLAGAVVAALGLAAGPVHTLPVRASAVVCVAVAVLLLVRRPGAGRVWIAVAAAAVSASLAVTGWVRWTGPAADIDGPTLTWSLAETAGLVAMVVLVVRVAPLPLGALVAAVGVLTAAAVSLRLSSAWGPPVQGFWFVVWGLAGAGGAALGGYLRTIDSRREQSVARAVREQRLALARDLHDYVGHDLTGIVVQAQAGQLVAGQDPAAAVAALRWIEKAGLQALSATDRAIQVTGQALGPGNSAGGIAEIAALVDRFAGPPATLALGETGEIGELPREVGAAAYRIVAEALTNVRRHAPAATAVHIRIERANGCLRLRISNAPGERPARLPPRTSGLGLVGLRERVEALGGRFDAGPDRAGGWLVEAEIPVPAP